MSSNVSMYDTDVDIYDDKDDEDLEMIRQLMVEETNCKECSKKWCETTQRMIQIYAEKTFSTSG